MVRNILKKSTEMKEYDKSKMQHKDGILRFQWGNYPAIGIDHFEKRRDERTKQKGTDIFDETELTDEQVLLECFKILEEDKYDEILAIIEANKPKHTEFIAGFQTDEIAENGIDPLFVFVVFSISVKETAMNDINQGEEFLSCITIVKDTYKQKRPIDENTIEVTMCLYFNEDSDSYIWRKAIPRF